MPFFILPYQCNCMSGHQASTWKKLPAVPRWPGRSRSAPRLRTDLAADGCHYWTSSASLHARGIMGMGMEMDMRNY